jgi:tRNA dimethylallyltransferase
LQNLTSASSSVSSPLIVIVGPTASGKSRLAMDLAVKLETEIISADSRLIYKNMNIGTAKPVEEDLKRIKHHMIDLVLPDQSFSVGDYKRKVDEILSRQEGRDPSHPLILAGGTGLYVKAVLYGLWDGPSADPALRRSFTLQEGKSKGSLYRELAEVDWVSSARIHPNDCSKIIRALEVFHLTGKPLSSFHSDHGFRNQTRPFQMIGLKIERKELYRRIEKRVDDMIQEGWIEEVESLMKNGYHEKLPSMLSLGYHTLCAYLKGTFSLDDAVRLIKQETRNYAKRQITWFNRDANINWVEWDGSHGFAEEIKNKIERFSRKAEIGC